MKKVEAVQWKSRVAEAHLAASMDTEATNDALLVAGEVIRACVLACLLAWGQVLGADPTQNGVYE